MSASRKEWIALRSAGRRVGWFGPSPEVGVEPVELYRTEQEPFDTIVATEIPEDGVGLLLEHLCDEGRLLVAVPFGAPYPSALVKALRARSLAVELDLVEGELRIAVDKKKPSIGAWQAVASPGRLLALTERGASEREIERAAELETLRSAYRRLAERLMQRESEKAGPAIATASRVLALSERVTDLNDRLRSVNESTDKRIGRALLLAARNPRDALRLPRRLLRAYVDHRRQAPRALPPPPPVDRELLSLIRRTRDGLALIVDGRPFDEASGIERHLSMEGWGVILAATQEPSDLRPAQRILRAEIDLLEEVFTELERAEQTPRVAVVRTPHPIAVRWVNRLNAWGWVTIYDCFDDWPERLRLGLPHRYRRSVERFLVHNVDVVCATEEAAARLAGLTMRTVRTITAREPSARGLALMEAASSVRVGDHIEKRLHARELG